MKNIKMKEICKEENDKTKPKGTMKNLLFICMVIFEIVFISGCISKENTTNIKTVATVDIPITLNEKTLTVGETLEVGDGVVINIQSVDNGVIPKRSDTIPKQVFLSIVQNGNILDSTVLENGENYHYGNIIELKVGDIYSTDTADGVTLKNIIYRQNGDAPLKKSKLLTVGETVELGNGFTMSIEQIYRESPRKASITLSESGIKKDEKTVVPGERYNYDNRITVNIGKIFSGPTVDIITMDIIK